MKVSGGTGFGRRTQSIFFWILLLLLSKITVSFFFLDKTDMRHLFKTKCKRHRK